MTLGGRFVSPIGISLILQPHLCDTIRGKQGEGGRDGSVSSVEDLRIWADRLEEVQDRLAPYFERAEPRHRAIAYIRGLVSVTERKNVWQLAELAGESTPDGMPIKYVMICNTLS